MASGASEPFVKPIQAQKNSLPYVVALTGGIAAGKTLVSNEFAKLGVPIIDMDVIAHEIVEPGHLALQEIANAFGKDIINIDGRLKRSQLRAIIFSDANSRNKLESILHPRIEQKASDAIMQVDSPYCILVIPLLAKKSTYPYIDRVLVVDVDSETQIERLMARDNSSRKLAQQALASQASREQRLQIADDILGNSGSPEQTRNEVILLHKKYLQQALEH